MTWTGPHDPGQELRLRRGHGPATWSSPRRITAWSVASFWELSRPALGSRRTIWPLAISLAGASSSTIFRNLSSGQLHSGPNVSSRWSYCACMRVAGEVDRFWRGRPEPEKLYTEGARAFEFERTASRLRGECKARMAKAKPWFHLCHIMLAGGRGAVVPRGQAKRATGPSGGVRTTGSGHRRKPLAATGAQPRAAGIDRWR